jgi:hypothetical protein
MDFSQFHKLLLGTDPTPDQVRLYGAFPKYRGYSNDAQEADRFIATFLIALGDTWDRDTKTSHTVSLAVPRAMESWCIEAINSILEKVKLRKKALTPPGVKMFVQAVKHVEMGSRVFSVDAAPKRWLAFGFKKEDNVPDWLRGGLML